MEDRQVGYIVEGQETVQLQLLVRLLTVRGAGPWKGCRALVRGAGPWWGVQGPAPDSPDCPVSGAMRLHDAGR